MSWLFSKAMMEDYGNSHSLQGQEAESSADTCSDGELFAQLNVMPTLHKFWRNDKTMEFSNLSRFGLTLRVLTEQDGETLLTSYLAAFPARTSALQERAQESKASAAAYGKSLPGLLARYDPATSSWKTAQCSLFEDLEPSLVIWPRWGSMRNGECYQQLMLVHHTSEKESGLWATPTTMDKLPPKSPEALLREATIARPGRSKPANLRDQVSNMHNWPTPSASDGSRGGTITEKMTGQSLTQAVNTPAMWPTPQASDNRDRGNLSTPAIARRVSKGKQVMLSMCVSEENGRLNPTWVEWLMGWPLGWTDLKPLAMDKFHSQWLSHFNSCLKGQDHE